MQRLLLVSIILFGCWSCEPRDTEPLLVGNWEWTQSSGGFAGGIIKPKAGERVLLNFSGKGTLSITQNDTLYISAKYRLDTIESIYSSDKATGIFAENIVNHQPDRSNLPIFFIGGQAVLLRLTSTELSIGDNAYDGYGSSFKRVN